MSGTDATPGRRRAGTAARLGALGLVAGAVAWGAPVGPTPGRASPDAAHESGPPPERAPAAGGPYGPPEAAPVRPDESDPFVLGLLALPPVELAGRVPGRWLRDDTDDYPLEPARWRRRLPRRCRTRGGYRAHCQGERRVPEPHGVAARVAAHLGLGHRATAMQVMHDRPLDEWLDAVAALDPVEALTFPVPTGRAGRGFGRVRRGSLRHRRHKGVDIGADEGAAVVAARGGLVVYAGDELTGYGNTLLVLHRDGFSTLYAHCRALHVFAGQRVARGQRVAEVGQTGFAHAPHLHFEWRQRGWPRDPAPHFVRDDPARGGSPPSD